MKIILIIGLIAVIVLAGCTGSKNQENGQTVATIDFYATSENWDSDSESDGIEFNLESKDSKGDLIEANGILSAKLYKVTGLYSDQKGDLIQEWNDIKVTKDNYDYARAKIRLEYKDEFKPTKYQIGWLEVTFKTNGKEFNAKDTSIMYLE